MSLIVPYNNDEKNRIEINPTRELKTTGLELGSRVSDSLLGVVKSFLQDPNSSTSALGPIGFGIIERLSAVGVNTIAPLLLENQVSDMFALRFRSLVGLGLNAGGFLSNTFQVIDPQADQRAAHVAQALQHLYRGGIDIAIYGANFIDPNAGVYLILVEGTFLLIAPNLVRSVANKVFGSVDALIDNSVSSVARWLGTREPIVKLPITNEQIQKLVKAREQGKKVSLALVKDKDDKVIIEDIDDGTIIVTDYLNEKIPEFNNDDNLAIEDEHNDDHSSSQNQINKKTDNNKRTSTTPQIIKKKRKQPEGNKEYRPNDDDNIVIVPINKKSKIKK